MKATNYKRLLFGTVTMAMLTGCNGGSSNPLAIPHRVSRTGMFWRGGGNAGLA